MKLGVVGSRNFDDYEFLEEILRCYEPDLIISGGAKGADSLAHRYAAEHNIKFKLFPADWDRLGRKAGPIRNRQIVEASDEIVAFWDKKSCGTAHTISLAKEAGKPVHIYWPKPDKKDFLEGIGI